MRRAFRLQINSKKNQETSKKSPSEKILLSMKAALKKLNLTLENSYRACDINIDGKVSHEEYHNFLDKLKLSLPKKKISKFLEAIDENCTGFIERDQFYECLEAYGIATEDHKSQTIPYSAKIMNKFQEKCVELNLSPVSIFKECSSNDEAVTEEIRKMIKKTLGFLEREAEVIIRFIDPHYIGIVKYSTFIAFLEQKRVMPKTSIQNSPLKIEQKTQFIENNQIQEDPNIAICKSKFKELLNRYSLDPHSIFRFSNKLKAEKITREQYIGGLAKLVKNFEVYISDSELSLFLPETITKEELQKLFPEENKEIEFVQEHEYWIKRFNSLMSKKGLNLQMIFITADSDKDGHISLSDLSLAFTDLFDKDFSQNEIKLIVNSFGLEKEKFYSYKNFYNIIKSL